MSGIKYLSQIDMRQSPTEDHHLIRMADMVTYVSRKIKEPVRVVQTTNFVGTYDNDPNELTLTQTTPAALVIDGVTLSLGDRILLAGQTDKTQNGIYTVTTLGELAGAAAVLTRADDFNTTAKITPNVKIPVAKGTINGDTTWVLTSDGPLTMDTSNIVFVKDSGGPTTRVVEEIFDINGDGSTTAFTFSHNWNTKNVTHEIYDASTEETVQTAFKRTSVNDVTVTFGTAPAIGEDYFLIVRAEVDPV